MSINFKEAKNNFDKAYKAGVYQFDKSINLPIIANIELDSTFVFVSADTSRTNLEKEKDRILSYQGGYSSIMLAHIDKSRGERIKKLINETYSHFIEGGYSHIYNGAGITDDFGFVVGSRELSNGDTLLVVCDIYDMVIYDNLLFAGGGEDICVDALKEQGIKPKKLHRVEERSGLQFMSSLMSDDESLYKVSSIKRDYECDGKYFYDLITKDVFERDIKEQKTRLERSISIAEPGAGEPIKDNKI